MTVAVAVVIPSEMLPTFIAIAFLETIAAVGICATVPVTSIVMPVYVSPEMLAPVIPGSGADKDTIREPFGAIVAVRSTFVRRIVEISVGADRCGTDLN
jgi:hypothetical protein